MTLFAVEHSRDRGIYTVWAQRKREAYRKKERKKERKNERSVQYCREKNTEIEMHKEGNTHTEGDKHKEGNTHTEGDKH